MTSSDREPPLVTFECVEARAQDRDQLQYSHYLHYPHYLHWVSQPWSLFLCEYHNVDLNPTTTMAAGAGGHTLGNVLPGLRGLRTWCGESLLVTLHAVTLSRCHECVTCFPRQRRAGTEPQRGAAPRPGAGRSCGYS